MVIFHCYVSSPEGITLTAFLKIGYFDRLFDRPMCLSENVSISQPFWFTDKHVGDYIDEVTMKGPVYPDFGLVVRTAAFLL